MTALSLRLQQPDMAGLSNAEAVAALNAPDPANPPAWCVVAVSDVARIFRRSAAPMAAQTSATDLKTAMVAVIDAARNADHPAHNTAKAAVEMFQRTDSPQIDCRDAGERQAVQVLFAALASPAANILDQAAEQAVTGLMQVSQSWAEANGVTVDVFAVAAARAGAQAVTLLGWQNNGPAAGGGVEEQANLRFTDGTELGVIFKLPMANTAALRTATLNQWLSNNDNLLS
jgi:hypothetical protein